MWLIIFTILCILSNYDACRKETVVNYSGKLYTSFSLYFLICSELLCNLCRIKLTCKSLAASGLHPCNIGWMPNVFLNIQG